MTRAVIGVAVITACSGDRRAADPEGGPARLPRAAAVEARDDLDIERLGSGTPLVVVPDGPGLSHHYFHPSVEALAAFHELIFYDPRGTGSSPPAEHYGLDEDVADLESVRERLGLERLQLMGHGYGALLVVRYAELFPERASTLVLVSPVLGESVFEEAMTTLISRLPANALSCIEGADSREDAAACLPVVARELLGRSEPGLVDGLLQDTSWDPQVFRRARTRMFAHMPDPGRLLVPILIIAGARDVVPLAAIRDFSARVHGSRLEVLEGCGHFPFIEDEARFARTVRRFLEEFDERRLRRREGTSSGRGD